MAEPPTAHLPTIEEKIGIPESHPHPRVPIPKNQARDAARKVIRDTNEA